MHGYLPEARDVKIKKEKRRRRKGKKQSNVTYRDRASETAQYSMLMSAGDDRTDRPGETADHRQVQQAKGQPVTGSVSFHSLSPSSSSSLTPPPPLSSRPGQLRHISRTHSHGAVIYPDSTLRLVFGFCTYI